MKLLYLIIAGIIIFFLYKKIQHKGIKDNKVNKKALLETEIEGIGEISIAEELVDLSAVKQANANKVIKGFKEPYTLEQKIIIKEPISFIYFASFFDSRIRYGETKPQNIPIDDYYRKYFEKAHDYGLAFRGKEIPTPEILSSLKLKELNKISNKQFTRIDSAIQYLLQLTDLDYLLDKIFPRENYFQLKNINLDMDFLQNKWEIIKER